METVYLVYYIKEGRFEDADIDIEVLHSIYETEELAKEAVDFIKTLKRNCAYYIKVGVHKNLEFIQHKH